MLKRVGVLALMLSAGSFFLPSQANAQDWRGRGGYHYNDRRYDNWRERDHRDHERHEWREREWERNRYRNEWRRENRYYNGYYAQPGYSYGYYYSTPDDRCPY